MPISKAQQVEKEIRRGGPLWKVKAYLKALGPGLITGASDDDPSGVMSAEFVTRSKTA